MKRFVALSALLAGLFVASGPALADEYETGGLIVSYTAYLSETDHYNSKGERLTEYWQIIRQDRANYHRFGLQDAGDEGDEMFTTADSRAALESMLQAYPADDWIAEEIVSGPVTVSIDIYGSEGVVDGVEVVLY